MSWAYSGTLATMTNGYLPPNSAVPDIRTHWTGYFGPKSYHPGGANVAMGDGSVRMLTEGMDVLTCRHLHSVNGSEVVSGF